MATAILIDYTGRTAPKPKEYAGRFLAYTKNTRLNMDPSGFHNFMTCPWEDIEKELEYMAGTIPSSWEFVNLTFLIQNVTRAGAQQITRTRTASFAMQSQRVLDVRAAGALIPPTVPEELVANYSGAINAAFENYSELIDAGVTREDARGVLPINANCNLVAQYNLRTMVELLRKRKSIRVQGEYREIVAQMEHAVLAAWPWTKYFFEHPMDKAIKMIEEVAMSLPQTATLSGDRAKLAKAADLIKGA